MSTSLTPLRASSSRAPATSASTTGAFQRVRTMAMRRPTPAAGVASGARPLTEEAMCGAREGERSEFRSFTPG